jgi:2-isopropylmalate synthase
MGLPTATVRMRGPDGIARTATGMGTGPVDAAYKAIDALVRVQVRFSTHCFPTLSLRLGFRGGF